MKIVNSVLSFAVFVAISQAVTGESGNFIALLCWMAGLTTDW